MFSIHLLQVMLGGGSAVIFGVGIFSTHFGSVGINRSF
jgi:hypothetical protein